MPLFEELKQTSQETLELDSDSNGSLDVCLNSLKSGITQQMPLFQEASPGVQYGIKQQMPLFEELRQTSQETFESESDSNVSWDVSLNSSKSGMLRFFIFRTFVQSYTQRTEETKKCWRG